MDKPILKNSLKLFEPLGTIKSRSMFGGFGIFADDTMFALVVQNTLHIRADSKSAQKFEQQGLKPYVYKKRGFPVVTKYFALPEISWENTDDIIEKASQALKVARTEKQKQAETKPTRLKDLPNLRLGTERMLKKAGISSVQELQDYGSVEAYKAIKQTHSSDVGLELLWALEGAIKGTHWSVIPQDRRDELMKRLS
ncbi:putative TfoX protein [Vibrio nigripulchritudo MADA3029]|uniref:TfoX protein n=4 Tax=Vibrio nigripulchritudo TaxID=28173 RepID=A0AAV2VKJ4_9VIBR|nr:MULTISPECIES: TfoX/Sxy family DNA transformation protein [Vibrio]KJY80980.1 DNA transformation protein [Vibrio nigripulchritudo]UAB69123.1 TfoX/Sxy family DNA transformation protein [Vibrio sp. SCSIO 43132]CCN33529.1 putative TfoX protein [Vibrio nigripulchritudo AM115]CCN41534.1 putative TfoX protein [Vibrio nigripulchritudo FTn2]CCN50416.1 putative TfoX protein [Vibrio nigripulchritudo MADA3020]